MGRLLYIATASLDGYTADRSGSLAWSAPDEEVHAFINNLQRQARVMLLGRRMYETLRVWEQLGSDDDSPAVIRDFHTVWMATDKVVYSTTLATPSTARTRIQRRFAAEAVAGMKASSNITLGGAHLAASAFAAALVDECHLFLVPVVLGGGTQAFAAGVQARLQLEDERRFAAGRMYLRYRVEH